MKYSWNPGTERFERSFVIGDVDGATAPASYTLNQQDLWAVCNRAYDRFGVLNPLPAELRECRWYVDYSLIDSTAITYAGTDSSAWKLLQNVVEWSTQRKDVIRYELPMTATNALLEIMDCVTVNDAIHTNGVNRSGWITRIEDRPDKGVIRVSVMMEPLDYTSLSDDLIIEIGSAADTYTESGSQPDTVTEGA